MAHWSFSAGFEAQRYADAIDDLRRRVAHIERECGLLLKHPAIVQMPSAPFAPTLEDFAALGLNNDKDDDGA